jgi:hypothetical protein
VPVGTGPIRQPVVVEDRREAPVRAWVTLLLAFAVTATFGAIPVVVEDAESVLPWWLVGVAAYLAGLVTTRLCERWFFPEHALPPRKGVYLLAPAAGVVLADAVPSGWWDVPILNLISGGIMGVATIAFTRLRRGVPAGERRLPPPAR